jgi:hypothetical protein
MISSNGLKGDYAVSASHVVRDRDRHQTDVRSDVVHDATDPVHEAVEAIEVVGLERSIPKYLRLCSTAKIDRHATTTSEFDDSDRVGSQQNRAQRNHASGANFGA